MEVFCFSFAFNRDNFIPIIDRQYAKSKMSNLNTKVVDHRRPWRKRTYMYQIIFGLISIISWFPRRMRIVIIISYGWFKRRVVEIHTGFIFDKKKITSAHYSCLTIVFASLSQGAFMLNFWGQNQRFSNVVRAKRCCVHAYFRINVVSKRWFKTPKNVCVYDRG